MEAAARPPGLGQAAFSCLQVQSHDIVYHTTTHRALAILGTSRPLASNHTRPHLEANPFLHALVKPRYFYGPTQMSQLLECPPQKSELIVLSSVPNIIHLS